MGVGFLKHIILAMLRPFNLGLYKRDSAKGAILARSGVDGLLQHVRSMGFVPATVIDVGAAYGAFTRQCRSVFPASRFILIEPLVEYQPALKKLTDEMPAIHCVTAVAAAHAGEAVLNVHPDLVGSSLLSEVEKNTQVNGVPRAVRAITLDGLIEETGAEGPFLLKADVQGAELEVLRGAERMLADTECILLEISLFRFFEGGPDLSDAVAYMKARGFVVYDISGFQYRPLDNALAQVDVTFVKEAGLFRTQQGYATPEQRQAQDRRIRAHMEELLARAQ
ncbi:MAG: FkbM family methyltransferase [Phycisphaerae bacterium]|nr:FkbM family methyltransferase [Phycisphaerae bacterium]